MTHDRPPTPPLDHIQHLPCQPVCGRVDLNKYPSLHHSCAASIKYGPWNELEGRHAPEGGWRPHTYYVVEMKASRNNVPHRVLFYTGFLDADGLPSGYNGFAQSELSYRDAYWIQPIAALPDLCSDFWETPDA